MNSDASNFSTSSKIRNQNVSFSKFSPRSIQDQQRYQVKLSGQIDEVLIDLELKSDGIQPVLQNELLVLGMVVRIVFHSEFSHLSGGLGHFADSNSIPQNQQTIFHPILIVATLLKYPLSLFVRLFQRCHLCLIDEVSKFDDSMIDLRNIFQIPINARKHNFWFVRRLEELS